MDFSAIICEFNPITFGHIKLIEETKKRFKLPIICIMSGNFVQRGEISIFNKYTRARHAIDAGADVVIELPTIYALSPASDFAYGAIKILSALGNVKHLVFGSECGDLDKLISAKDKLLNLEKTEKFKSEAKKGYSYASSVLRISDSSLKGILEKPNNLLAVEYLKALAALKSSIIPYTIKREDNYNNSSNIINLPSSSYIRKLISETKITDAIIKSPKFIENSIKNYRENSNGLNSILLYNMQTVSPDKLNKISEVNEGLEYRLSDCAIKSTSYSDFINACYTKRYKDSKISRIIIKNTLSITSDTLQNAKTSRPYAKMLMIRESIKHSFIKSISKNIDLIITKKDYDKLPENEKEIFDIDIKASKLSSIYHGVMPNLDFTQNVIKKD